MESPDSRHIDSGREATTKAPPRWQRLVLYAACIHCGVWSVFIMALPELSAKVYGFATTPHDLHLWQGTGLFIGLLAVGHGMAARDPRQHWGIVFISLLAKVLGAAGMTTAVFRGQVSSNVLWLLPINDLIWCWPFWRIVRDNCPATKRVSEDNIERVGPFP